MIGGIRLPAEYYPYIENYGFQGYAQLLFMICLGQNTYELYA